MAMLKMSFRLQRFLLFLSQSTSGLGSTISDMVPSSFLSPGPCVKCSTSSPWYSGDKSCLCPPLYLKPCSNMEPQQQHCPVFKLCFSCVYPIFDHRYSFLIFSFIFHVLWLVQRRPQCQAYWLVWKYLKNPVFCCLQHRRGFQEGIQWILIACYVTLVLIREGKVCMCACCGGVREGQFMGKEIEPHQQAQFGLVFCDDQDFME